MADLGWTVSFTGSHYSDVITGAIESQINSLIIIYSTVYSDADPRKHQSSVSLAFVRGIHRGPVNSPQKGPVTRKMFPFDHAVPDDYRQHVLAPCCLLHWLCASNIVFLYFSIRVMTWCIQCLQLAYRHNSYHFIIITNNKLCVVPSVEKLCNAFDTKIGEKSKCIKHWSIVPEMCD